MTPRRRLAGAALFAAILAACDAADRELTAPPVLQPESVVVRFERSSGVEGPDEILTITGLGHVTWREVRSGSVARFRITVDQLLSLERAFDDANFDGLPAEVAGSRCAACPTIVLTSGVGAGERSVILTGDPSDHPRGVRDIIAGLEALTGRARAERSSALGSGGSAADQLPSGLAVALSVGRAAIHPGDPLYLRLTVTNPYDDRFLRLVFPTSSTADFRVENADGRVVWSLAGERARVPGAIDVVLGPGESRALEEVWLGRSGEGETVEPGSYVAVGVVPASFGGETPPVAFQIR